MKGLIIKIGTNKNDLQEISMNNELCPCEVVSEHFQGKIVVRVRETGKPSAYFKNKARNFSIQFSGQFKAEISAEDLVFGAVFDRKISPPYGSSLAMTFANYIDPSLESDLYCAKPWLLSPLICAMNILNIERMVDDAKENVLMPDDGVLKNEDKTMVDIPNELLPPILKEQEFLWPWINGRELVEDTRALTGRKLSSSERRMYFNQKSKLKSTKITPDMIVNGDFFGPVVDFSNFCVNLGPFSFDISSYVEGQPITFSAKSKSSGKTFFLVQFDQKL